MSTTVEDPTADAPAPLTNCPSCGSHVLTTVTLDYGASDGYRPDALGVTPEQGDTITRCDDCGAFFVRAEDGTVAGQTAPEPAAAAAELPASGEEEVQPSAVVQLEEFFAAKLQQLEDALGGRVAELEAELAAKDHELASKDQELAAATATPPEPPAGEAPAPEDGAPPPVVTPTPDPPATEGGSNGPPQGA